MKACLVRSKKWLLTIAVVSGCVICTSYLSLKVKQQFRQEHYAKLQSIGQQVQVRLQESIDLAVNDLRALQSFYLSSETVTLEEFTTYTQVLLDSGRDHIQALSWVPIVEHGERDAFEATMRKHYPDFRIAERNMQEQVITRAQSHYYYPVTYIQPFERNAKALGFDINSNPIRRESLDFTRDTGEMTATAKIRLVQEKGDSFGFLIVVPVYHLNQPLNDAAQRESALRGFVSGVFRGNNLVDNAQQFASQENLLLTLTDNTTKTKDILYGDTKNVTDFSFDLNLPQRNWQLHLTMNDTLRHSIQTPAVIVWIMSGGILLSLLMGICVNALIQSAASGRRVHRLNQQIQTDNTQLEKTVVERTEDLSDKNQRLEQNIEELTNKRRILVSLMEDAQTEKQIAEQQAIELARSNRDLDDFAYVASHDLKSPLRGIDQLASWVIEDLEAGNMTEIPENLTMMRQRVQRLESLLNDLLAYSRIGRDKAKIASVDSAALANELFLLNSPPPGFQLTTEGSLPVFTTAIVPFEQVIRNLLSNAVKHHDRNNGQLQISCTEEDNFYTFAVNDDGPGIEPKHHEHIFKMFKALKPRDEVEGSGMGLSMIKKIVEYYGGKVYLESTVGQGTTFYFSWPKVI